jgi:hypothetical protein
MRRNLPVLIALAMLLLAGLVHGVWTDRWGRPDEPPDFGRLQDVPSTLGEWRGETVEADKNDLDLAHITSTWMRRYTHGGRGDVVTVLLMSGRAGPLSVHTPEACYRGAGFQLLGDRHKYRQLLEGKPPAEFWTARFRKASPTGPLQLRIFWSWKATGPWSAPQVPRLSFARVPVLYKLYVVRETATASDLLEEDPCMDLMRKLLPEMDERLTSR